MSVHQITIYFVIPLRRIQHESEFMNYQHLPCSLNILGAHTFNYFLHFNLELLIRIWFFFFPAEYSEMFLLQLGWCPPASCTGLQQAWWMSMSNNLSFCRAFHRSHLKAPHNGIIIISVCQRRNQGTKLLRRSKKHPGLTELRFSASSTVFTAAPNLCLCCYSSLPSSAEGGTGERTVMLYLLRCHKMHSRHGIRK